MEKNELLNSLVSLEENNELRRLSSAKQSAKSQASNIHDGLQENLPSDKTTAGQNKFNSYIKKSLGVAKESNHRRANLISGGIDRQLHLASDTIKHNNFINKTTNSAVSKINTFNNLEQNEVSNAYKSLYDAGVDYVGAPNDSKLGSSINSLVDRANSIENKHQSEHASSASKLIHIIKAQLNKKIEQYNGLTSNQTNSFENRANGIATDLNNAVNIKKANRGALNSLVYRADSDKADVLDGVASVSASNSISAKNLAEKKASNAVSSLNARINKQVSSLNGDKGLASNERSGMINILKHAQSQSASAINNDYLGKYQNNTNSDNHAESSDNIDSNTASTITSEAMAESHIQSQSKANSKSASISASASMSVSASNSIVNSLSASTSVSLSNSTSTSISQSNSASISTSASLSASASASLSASQVSSEKASSAKSLHDSKKASVASEQKSINAMPTSSSVTIDLRKDIVKDSNTSKSANTNKKENKTNIKKHVSNYVKGFRDAEHQTFDAQNNSNAYRYGYCIYFNAYYDGVENTPKMHSIYEKDFNDLYEKAFKAGKKYRATKGTSNLVSELKYHDGVVANLIKNNKIKNNKNNKKDNKNKVSKRVNKKVNNSHNNNNNNSHKSNTKMSKTKKTEKDAKSIAHKILSSL